MQQAGDRAAGIQHLVDLLAHRRVVGAEQRGATGLQEVDVAVAVHVGHVGAVGLRDGQRERVVEGQVVLHAAGDHGLGPFGQALRALAALVEVAHHLRHLVGADGPHRLLDQLVEAAVEAVDIGPGRDGGARRFGRCGGVNGGEVAHGGCAWVRLDQVASASATRRRAGCMKGSRSERAAIACSSSVLDRASRSSTACRAVTVLVPQHSTPWLNIR